MGKTMKQLMCLCCLLLLAACTDELVTQQGEAVCPVGEPASVTLDWGILESAIQTRSTKLDEEAESQVTSLWIGVYNCNTGKCTYNNVFTVSHEDEEPYKHTVKLENLVSGRSYIVAVANVRSNYGVMEGEVIKFDPAVTVNGVTYTSNCEDGENPKKQYRMPLYVLLKYADTFDKYKKISSVLLTSNSVSRGAPGFPMSGYYCPKASGTDDVTAEHPAKWYTEGGNPLYSVYIEPGNNNFDGTIHLRRQEAYVRFNIKAAAGITVVPNSWQVVNVPMLSYLLQNGKNAGDDATSLSERSGFKSYYTESDEYSDFDDLTEATKDGKTNVGWFDFYMYGNQHSGIIEESSDQSHDYYADREKEYKTDGNLNTGVYRSLVSEADYNNNNITTNNNATFVVLKANVSYYARQKDDGTYMVETDATTAEGDDKLFHRTGTVKFTIHLGYCEGDTEWKKSNDFSCMRNTCYTYNIVVEGLENIRIESVTATETENQPGMEGDMSDAKDFVFELDAHYGTFNIKLNNAERATLSYYITVPYGDTRYRYNSKSDGDVSTFFKNPEFWQWIEFYPTRSEKLLAKYPGKDKAWTLKDLQDPANKKSINNKGQEVTYNPKGQNSTDYYFTVFINEYVYTKDYKNTAEAHWSDYTNKTDRLIWLMNDNERIYSPDTESSYIHSTYLIKQNSIETYYNTDSSYGGIGETAIGIERTNESFGLNLGVPSNTSGSGLTVSNGRYNTWRLVVGASLDDEDKIDWNTMWVETKNGDKTYLTNQVVPAINNLGIVKAETTYYVPTLKQDNTNYDASINNPQPKDKGYYYAYKACMNRNRDLDGDGKISRDELRWFLPSSRVYFRIIMGQNSLSNPLMTYPASRTLPNGVEWIDDNYTSMNFYNGMYHYISSDLGVIWAEEGMSLSLWSVAAHKKYYTNSQGAFWQIRCIRGLGLDYDSDTGTTNHVMTSDDESDITKAYTFGDNKGHTVDDNKGLTVDSKDWDFSEGGWFEMTYYESKNNRPAEENALAYHEVNSPINRTPFRFEFYKESIYLTESMDLDTWWGKIKDGYNPCASLNETTGRSGWRIPNQQELMCLLMLNTNNVGFNLPGESIACSQEYFGNDESGGIGIPQTTSSYLQIKRNTLWTSNSIRCVRDVITQ